MTLRNDEKNISPNQDTNTHGEYKVSYKNQRKFVRDAVITATTRLNSMHQNPSDSSFIHCYPRHAAFDVESSAGSFDSTRIDRQCMRVCVIVLCHGLFPYYSGAEYVCMSVSECAVSVCVSMWMMSV